MNAGDLKIEQNKRAPYLKPSTGACYLYYPHGISEVRRCGRGLNGGSQLAVGADWSAGLATLAATEAAFAVRELGMRPSYQG